MKNTITIFNYNQNSVFRRKKNNRKTHGLTYIQDVRSGFTQITIFSVLTEIVHFCVFYLNSHRIKTFILHLFGLIKF